MARYGLAHFVPRRLSGGNIGSRSSEFPLLLYGLGFIEALCIRVVHDDECFIGPDDCGWSTLALPRIRVIYHTLTRKLSLVDYGMCGTPPLMRSSIC